MTPGSLDSRNPKTTIVDKTENLTENTEKGKALLPAASGPNAFARTPEVLDGGSIDLLSPMFPSIRRAMMDQAFITPSLISFLPFCEMLNMALTAFSFEPDVPGF
jgi:hypothetical protein